MCENMNMWVTYHSPFLQICKYHGDMHICSCVNNVRFRSCSCHGQLKQRLLSRIKNI